MTAICAVVAGIAAAQGCASSGTVTATGTPTAGTGTPATSPASATGTTAPSTPDSPSSPASSSSPAAPDTPASSPASSPAAPDSPSAPGSPPAPGHWQPTGDLAKADPVGESVGPDKKLTATWPKGAPADKALTVKLLAKRNGDKLDVTLFADNRTDQKVSLLTGMFGGAVAVDDTGANLEFDEFDDDWKLEDPSDDGYLVAGQPLVGTIVISAPKTGNTFNLYWTQAVNYSGILLIRDIPIVG